jgi:hypothetical protein
MLISDLRSCRRDFLRQLSCLGIAISGVPFAARAFASAADLLPGTALQFPGPWQFQLPKPSIILVSDQQLEDLQDPDKEVDLSLSSTPNLSSLRKMCEQAKAQGARTIILAFDEFWSQYRKGQGGKPRQLLPDTGEYVQRLAKISQMLKSYGLGLELSLLSPLELGRGYQQRTGESGHWVQYREGYRDPKTGLYTVSLWEQRRWTNNKGTIELKRSGIRVFAFRERRVGGTSFYAVEPASIVELKTRPELIVDESQQPSTSAHRLTASGRGETEIGELDRVLVVIGYASPEMDYFSPQALPFLQGLVDQYHAAGVPLNGLYADEMHIQQDWGYSQHHDDGQFTFRYLTPNLARQFAQLYGADYTDLEKHLVYFCYGQHSFYPNLEARLPAQHVLGGDPEQIQRTFLLRRRYYDLLERTVVSLFTQAKQYAEAKYGHELEARAHATWAQSPTCDIWVSGNQAVPPRQYDYTPDFLWSNTVQQAAAACSDYFEWNAFLTGGGNDHAEGGWLDRNYYGIALACSTGILNKTPYAYAAAWGMPGEVWRRRQAVCDAFGASATPWFQAIQDSQHRDTEVLMLYPSSLVACEERFGSWMVQYGYANYVTPRKLIEHARVEEGGALTMAGRKFSTVAVLFEPLPPPELIPLLEQFLSRGGKVVWSGPPPRVDFAGNPVLGKWQALFGVKTLRFGAEGLIACGREVKFHNQLQLVPAQSILTDFLVDRVYPVEAETGSSTAAKVGDLLVGTYCEAAHGGRAVYLGFRPRDDQAASLGMEVRTWFEVLQAIGVYPASSNSSPRNDNPSVISRTTPYVACRFPNGTTAIAAHYRQIVECWPGGFHRDDKQDEQILKANPMPSAELRFDNFSLNGRRISYTGELTVGFRLDERGSLLAFAGHSCRSIRIDDREFTFASEPMALAAWAPVLPERRVVGGAAVEIWAHGTARMRVPLPAGLKNGKLYFQGATLESLGSEIPCKCSEGNLEFDARAEWPQKHLFFVPV